MGRTANASDATLLFVVIESSPVSKKHVHWLVELLVKHQLVMEGYTNASRKNAHTVPKQASDPRSAK